ncbi:MAG: amidohydrolase family protein [Arcicella sp.]|nr:amidohydrolase family protein [Arcicella sp.]
MARIDSHQHFWQYNPQKHGWITDDMKVIQRDFLPSDLQPILQKNNIDGCISVQADQTETETEFLLELSDNHDFIKGIVGWVDLQVANIDERLVYYNQFKKLKGFRHIVQSETDSEFMLRPKFKNGIIALSLYDFTYDILIYHYQLEQAIQFVALFPNQKFVLDHLGKPDIKSGEYALWQTNIKKLALHQNVFCKISSMITEGEWDDWKPSDFTVYLDIIVKAFGTDRLMYGSDFPVCTLAATYEAQLNITTMYFSTFTNLEKKKIMGDNASKFYGI